MTTGSDFTEDLRILLVDDSFDSLNLIRNMLKDLGVTQVFTAKNGIEALDVLSVFDGEDAINVVLCDWNMPQMSGLDVLKQIRTCDPDLPFLMITGNADMGSVMEAKSYGVTGYVKKPFSVDQLKKKLSLVSRILSHRSRDSLAT